MRTISKSFGLENSRSHVKVERKKCKSEWAGGGQYLLLAIKKMLVLLILFLISIRCKLGEKTIVSSIAQLLHDFIYCNSERMNDRVFISH